MKKNQIKAKHRIRKMYQFGIFPFHVIQKEIKDELNHSMHWINVVKLTNLDLNLAKSIKKLLENE